MGLLDKIFGNKKEPEQKVEEYFQMLNGYAPTFHSFEGGVYEMDLTRSVIHSFATHCSKLNMEVMGKANETLGKTVRTKVNPYMTTSAYLYRLATIFQVTNNAFIVPIRDSLKRFVIGYFPVLPEECTIVSISGVEFLKWRFGAGTEYTPFSDVGVITQYQYSDDFFGDSNSSMKPILNLMKAQNEGIIEGIKQGAAVRFLAKLSNVLRDDDLKKEQERFSKMNLSTENKTGVAIFDNKYQEVKQILSKPYTVNAEEMKDIKDSVYTHFGTNELILQNRFDSGSWSAYYEGVIEPFAIKASQTHTNITFSEREKSNNNSVMFTANRLQYLSNQEKLQTVTQLFDRGFLTHNQGLEIFNMSPVEDGDKRYIRKEYSEAMKLDSPDETENYSEVEDDTAE